MTIEEVLRSGRVRTADNGLNFAVIPADGENGTEDRSLERMAASVPQTLVPRLGRTATYFVPWLYKQRRSVVVGTQPAAEGETRKEMCHHLDVKPGGNLLLISLKFYEHDSYGLGLEFFDKIAYLASLEAETRPDFDQMLRQQWSKDKAGELTEEAWEWRQSTKETDVVDSKGWQNYARAAETDALGLYMAATFTDIFYEDLFEPQPGFPTLGPDLVYERVRTVERLYPANRGYNFQVVRQRPRRRTSSR